MNLYMMNQILARNIVTNYNDTIKTHVASFSFEEHCELLDKILLFIKHNVDDAPFDKRWQKNIFNYIDALEEKRRVVGCELMMRMSDYNSQGFSYVPKFLLNEPKIAFFLSSCIGGN